jgi:phospholipase C
MAVMAAPEGARPAAKAHARLASAGPIKHVVIIYQENHDFDNILGLFCVQHPKRHCDGRIKGVTSTGKVIPLKREGDIVPNTGHKPKHQLKAIAGGTMRGFDKIPGCSASGGYRCFATFGQSQIPSLWALASRYAIADRMFEVSKTTSWGAHLELVSTTLDGFTGYNPHRTAMTREHHAPGWGCDSYDVAPWRNSEGVKSFQPSCIPFVGGGGTFRKTSPVRHVPTIMDRLQKARLTFRLYAASPSDPNFDGGYGWAICPSFADCIYTNQVKSMSLYRKVLKDAQAGNLANFSVVMPTNSRSQHGGKSMMRGDNWIARVVNAIGEGPDWRSTAIFITYDDCGCFYDHVRPPPGFGIRLPMVIVSPYARRHYVDHGRSSFVSMLSYVERIFGLTPLTPRDRRAYGFGQSFNYSQRPLRYIPLKLHKVPASSIRYLKTHPTLPDTT